MIILCLLRFNVLLSVLISALIAGLVAQVPMLETMNTLINGMKGNLQTALSYILLGAIAAAISKTNLTAFLIKIVSHFISHKKYLLILSSSNRLFFAKFSAYPCGFCADFNPSFANTF